MTGHATGTREEWRRARIALLELEEEHTRRGDELVRSAGEDQRERRMGRRFEWLSSLGSDFNVDVGVSFTEEQRANGVVYHVYSTYGRGTDVFNTFYQLLDRAPKGRDEDDIPLGEWWWRRDDEYGNGRGGGRG